MDDDKRSPEFWRHLKRFVCIGGEFGGRVVSGDRLRVLYGFRPGECIVTNLVGPGLLNPTLLGLEIEAYPDRYTILTPVEDHPGVQHTANGYGFPHVDIPLTQSIRQMVDVLNAGDWEDLIGMSVLADNLEEQDFKDHRFPWLISALRDPDQAPYIDKRIWRGVLIKNTLARLYAANQQAMETFRRVRGGSTNASS